MECHHAARAHFDGRHADRAPVRDQKLGGIVLVEALDRRIFKRGLEERVQHVEAGLIRGKPGALDLHAAERPHRHLAVRLPAPGAAPVLHMDQFQGGGVDEQLDRVLVAEPVPTRHGVVEMVVEAVVILDHARSSALGGNRVAAHGIDLGDQRDIERGVALGGRDGGAQAGTSSPDDRDVGDDHVHEDGFLPIQVWRAHP